jgi:peptide/nickel transport system permease protein
VAGPLSYAARRIAMAIGLLLAVSALTFGAMNLLGDPLFNLLGPAAEDTSPAGLERIEAAKAEYHLDDPLPVRYVRWLGDFTTGDMGVQFSSDGQPPVSDLVAERLPRTAVLLVLAQLLATAIAIPWALLAAPRVDSWFDRLSTVSTFLVVAVPNFALGVVLKYVFSIRLGWFPQTYIADAPLFSRFHQLLLPAITIALPAAAVYQRLLRDDLATTLQEEYILMARAKGLARRAILFRHALRPSLFSFVTVFGLTTGALIGGSLVVENIFRVPGLGSAIVEAVVREDFPVVLAIVMVVAIVFVVVNFVVDAVYTLIDPRVRR